MSDTLLGLPSVLGVDIGGANLKFANVLGDSLTIPFPMWTDHPHLGKVLADSLCAFMQQTQREYSQLALTITGEMADCFPTRRQGVASILDQVQQSFPPAATKIYAVGNAWLTPAEAREHAWRVAASNWHALATWVSCCDLELKSAIAGAKQVAGANSLVQNGLVLDIGSTTVDIIPVRNGCVATAAETDRQRLQLGQLVYTGVGRTAVASILSEVELGGVRCPLVSEKFATSDDVYLVLGLNQEDPLDCDTADGRPRTRAHALARLARMIAEDLERLSVFDVEEIARQIFSAQAQKVNAALHRNLSHLPTPSADLATVVISGHGPALAREALTQIPVATRVVWLSDRLSAAAARAAPAVAVAWLLSHSSAARSAIG